MRKILLILPLLCIIGCGGGKPNDIVKSVVPVSGRVVCNGAPLANVVVTFYAMKAPGNDAMAVTLPDGSFRLGTFKGDDGAIPGSYKVTVEPHPHKGGNGSIPETYRRKDRSPFEVVVDSAKDGLVLEIK